MKRAIGVMVGGAFAICALTTPTQSQTTCNGSISSNNTGGGFAGCPGSPWQRWDYTITGDVDCNDVGVGQKDTENDSKSHTATGTCSGDSIQCAWSTISQNVSTGDGGTTITWTWNNGAWTGSSCTFQERSEYETYQSMGPCMGTFCCSGGSLCQGGQLEWDESSCRCFSTPLVIALNGTWQGALTSAARGAEFRLVPGGRTALVAWPQRQQQNVGWLTRDRNGNGTIDDGSELYGTSTPQVVPPGQRRHGFTALATDDTNGDGLITPDDSTYPLMNLWLDTNHDGRSTADELRRLSDLGIVRIDLRYRSLGEVDSGGNWFIYQSSGVQQLGNHLQSFRVYDVVVKTTVVPPALTGGQ